MTKINVIIEIGNLGETSIEEAKAYSNEVKSQLQTEYPESEINVSVSNKEFASIKVSGFEDDNAVNDNVNDILNSVWDSM